MSKLLKASLRKTVAGIVAFATILSLSGVIAFAPVAQAATIVDGALIKSNAVNSDGTPTYKSLDVYIVKLVGAKKFKRLMLNPQVLTSYGHLAGAVVNVVDQATMDSYTTSALVRVDTDPAQKVFALVPNDDTGAKSWVNVSTADFLAAGADPESVYTINSVDGGNYAAVGDITTQAQVTTFLTSGVLPTGVIPGTGLSVSLAADNAPAANVQKGSANNNVLKFTLVGGATATTVTGITLKSYGTTEATGSTDISAVKLYDESGIQVGNNRTPAGNQVNFVIVPALSIPANGSRTVTVTADIGSSAATLAVVRYGIETAAGITGATFTGTFPIIGNSFNIVPAGQLGTITVSQFGSLPKTAVKIGEKDIVFEKFNVSAGSNEDVAINQITLTNAGTMSASDVSNLRIVTAGTTTVLAGPVTVSNNKATFNLTTPINLTKGASTNLDLIGDVVDGNSHTISFSIAAGGVVGKGATSGTNVSSTGTTTTNAITIGNETVTVSMSASHPQGAAALIIKTTNKKDLAKFDVRANGGQVILNTVTIKNVDATNGLTTAHYLSSVGLYDGDSLISNLRDVTVETDLDFSLNYTLPANTTKVLTLKGITNTLTLITTGDSLVTTWSGYSGYGLASGATISSTTDYAATAITIYASGTVTPAVDSTIEPYNQFIVAPANNVTIAALKGTAQREDMKLTDLVVTVTGAGAYDDEGDTSSITLYAADGTTVLTNPIAFDTAGADDAVDTFTIGTADILNDIVFAKGVAKTILVKANFAAGATGTTGLTVTIADTAANLKFIGQDSGTAFDNSTDGSAVVFAISSPYAGGTYSVNTEVVTITKAATSPSGSVARGSQTVAGIWDVTNNSSTNTDITITGLTLTSKTGLPSALDDADNNAAGDQLFSLYDGDGNLLAGGTGDTGNTVIVKADGTVAFTAVGLTVTSTTPKQIKLLVNTTSTANFASNTQFQWAVAAVGHVAGANVGYGAGVSPYRLS